MLEVVVERHMTQCRNQEEIRQNLDYLANLPRITLFRLQSLEFDEPIQQGLLWYYRGVMQFCQKREAPASVIAKDKDAILSRIQRACQHKRWGRAPWRIEERVPTTPEIHLGDDLAWRASPDQASTAELDIEAELSEDEIEMISYLDIDPINARIELPGANAIREITNMFKMMSDGTRLKVMLILAQGERNVSELLVDLGILSQPAVSHHLGLLRACRLIEPRRCGKHNYYDLTDGARELVDLVNGLIEGGANDQAID